MWLVNAKNVQLCQRQEKLLLYENNLVLRTGKQSVVKRAWAFLQPVAALTVTHPGA